MTDLATLSEIRVEGSFQKAKPVTQDWVNSISLMQQTVLLSAIRGCDGISKRHKSKALVKWYRRCILISAFDGRTQTTPYEPGVQAEWSKPSTVQDRSGPGSRIVLVL